jgi:hypothetical protein
MSELHRIAGRVVDVEQPDDTRFGHVVRHLYVAGERWDLAIAELPRDLRRRATSGSCRSIEVEPGSGYRSACAACQRHVLADHAEWYLPAALAAVETAVLAGHVGRVETAKGPRELFVGANAVQVLTHLQRGGGSQRFVTAYRNAPGGQNPTNAHFHAKAVRKLRDKTSLGQGELP